MSACGVTWPVCPACPGAVVVETAGRVRCERCGSSWPSAERVPCPDPGTVVLADGAGAKGLVCASHAAHPSAAALKVALRPAPGGGAAA